MKTYTGTRGYQERDISAISGNPYSNLFRGDAIVKVDGKPLSTRLDLANHSPDGFEWGYGGSGPAQLALALLADALGDDREAMYWYQDFKSEVIARLQHDSWTLTETSIRETVACIRHNNPARVKLIEEMRPTNNYLAHVKACAECRRAENGEAPDFCPKGNELFKKIEEQDRVQP